MGFRSWLVRQMVDYLTRPLPDYERRGVNDPRALKAHVRKGDVILVEGDQRVSAIIRYLTQSSWSHSALYIGAELLDRGGEQAAWAREHFGDEATHLVVEALPEGVSAAPLVKYIDSNVRLCRPHRLRAEHLEVILDDALAAVGWRYDVRNILDLAFYLVLVSLFPSRYRRDVPRLGSGTATEVICTSLLGRLFQKVRFAVLPSVTFPDGVYPRHLPPRLSSLTLLRRARSPYVGVFRQLHHTLLTPRDFDLSPYFDIVKFNVIEQWGFDYQKIEWADDLSEVG